MVGKRQNFESVQQWSLRYKHLYTRIHTCMQGTANAEDMVKCEQVIRAVALVTSEVLFFLYITMMDMLKQLRAGLY